MSFKKPKDIEPECWEKFEQYLKEYASEIALKLDFFTLWSIWYDGYTSGYPKERNVK